MLTNSDSWRKWLRVLAASSFAISPIALTGCDDNDGFEEIGEELDEAADDIGDAIDDLDD